MKRYDPFPLRPRAWRRHALPRRRDTATTYAVASATRGRGHLHAFAASAVAFILAVTVLTVSTNSAGSVNAAPSSTSLKTAIKAGAKLSALPSATTPSLAGDVGDKELGGPMFPLRCVAESQSQSTAPICPLADTSATKTMVLLGDSQAHMWAAAFVAIAEEHHERLIILAKDGCPPWLATYLTTGMSPYPQCTAFHTFTLNEVKKLHPAQIYVTGAEGPLGVSTIDLKPVTHLLNELRKVTPATTVLSNIPWPTLNPVTCLSAHSSDIGGCGMPYGEFTSLYGKFRKTLKEAAKKSGTHFADLDSLFCTKSACPTVVANHLVYYDNYHITWQYAAYVATAMNQILAPTLTTKA